MSFFSAMTDHSPAFYLYIGDPKEGSELMDDGVLLQTQLQNTIQGIEVTKELGKPGQMNVSFAYGVGDKLTPLPWIQSANPGLKKDGTKKEASEVTKLRKVLLYAKYQNISSGQTLEDQQIHLVKQITKTDVKLQSSLGTGVTVTVKSVELENDEPKLYTGILRKDATIFNGLLSRPTGGGNQDGIIRIQANATGSFTLWGNNPLRAQTSGSADINDTPAKNDTGDLPSDSVSAFDRIKELISKTFKIEPLVTTDKETGKRRTVFVDFTLADKKTNAWLRVDISELEDVTRLKKTNNLGKGDKRSLYHPPPIGSTPMAYINYLCRQYNLDYTCNYTGDGIEDVKLFAREKTLLEGIKLEKAAQPGDNFGIYLTYGFSVISFNWNCTLFATASGGSATVEAKDNQLSIGSIDENGVHFETPINQQAIKDWVKIYGGPSGDSTKAIEMAIEFARSNADAFIAWFIDLQPNTKHNVKKQVGYGQSGITLSMELKWAIPGLTPGTLIYFDTSNRTEMPLPDAWVGFYKISVVKDKFNPRENIWTQTIECIR